MKFKRALTLHDIKSSAFLFGPRLTGKTTLLRDLPFDAFFDLLDPELVLETRTRVHLDDHENVNYLLAIKRVIGMAPLPGGAFYRAC